VNSMYREEINELSKTMVPTSPSRRKHKITLPAKEAYDINNFEKDTSTQEKVYYDNNKKINLSEEEDDNDSSTKEFKNGNFSSGSSDYYRKKIKNKKKRRQLRHPNEKLNHHHLLTKCASLKKIHVKSSLSKLDQHIISICKDENETKENKLLNNIECYNIMQNKRNQKLLMQFRLRQLGIGLNYRQYLAYMKTKNENKKYDLKDLEKIQFREYKNSIKKFIKELESKVKAPQVVQTMISSKVEEVEQNSESSESEKPTATDDEGEECWEMDRPEVREARRQLFKRIPYQIGRGYTELFNGNKYWGELDNNLMNGVGHYEWNNGLVYEGEFENNTINGIGKYTWKNSNSYVGSIESFVRNGFGKYVNKELKKNYVGEWKNGKFNGYGILKYDQDGKSYYEGEFLNNNKHGKGKMVYASGNVYTGDWKNNLKDGFGKMEFKNRNEQYVGFWKNNLPNGKGIYTWNIDSPLNCQYPLHNQYEGDWDNGKKWGHGIFRYSSGAIYDGEWFDNMKHGIGIYISEYGYIYDGVFKYDRATEPFSYYSNDYQHFFDLSQIYDDEKTREKQLKSLNTIIVRYIFELNSIYLRYRNYQPKTNNIYENYSLTYLQLWKLLEDCEISKLTNYTLVDMNREYAKIFKNKNYLNYKFHGLHNENQHLTLHDFYEYLIHISYLLYANVDIPSINEDGIAVCFSHFIKTNILEKGVNSSAPVDSEKNDNNLGTYIFQDIKNKYGSIIYDMYKDRAYYHKKSLQPSKGDLTLNMRDIIYILKDYEILDNEVLTLKNIIKIFSIYFIPGIDEDDVFNFDYELLPYEFIRFLFYCIIVKYCPNDNYIKLKQNKLNNNNNTDDGPIIISEQEVKKEEEENGNNNASNNGAPPTKNDNIPVTPANPKDAKKSEGATEKGNGKKSTLDINDSISSIKGNKSNVSSSQKKRQPSTTATATEIPEKPEPTTTKNGKKTAVNNNISQIPEDKVGGGGENKKEAAPSSPSPSSKIAENRSTSTSNSSSPNTNHESERNNSNPNPLKFKYFEFNEDNSNDPSYIIDTFLNKLLISNKEDDNDSFIKTDDNASDTDDDEIQSKEKKEKEIIIPTIDKLKPDIQDWMMNDIHELLDGFSSKLAYFKQRDENQRLALFEYNKSIIDRQLALKHLKEEQMNLNKRLQNEIKNSKWVMENISKFNEVTNDVTGVDGSGENIEITNSQTIQTGVSQQSSQQQLMQNIQQNHIPYDVINNQQ